LKIKKIYANEQQLNMTDIVMTFCLHCKTDYTLLAREGIDHNCYNNSPIEFRNITGQSIQEHISRATALNLLGNRSTDHNNERQYEQFNGYEAWAHLDQRVIESGTAPIGDKAQIIILRKETKPGGIQPSPFTNDFISLPRRIVMAVLSFFNLEIKPR